MGDAAPGSPAQKIPVRPRPYRLQNEIQPYEWGTRDGEAFIPRLLGFEPEPGRPYAELWIGAHPKAPSKVRVEGGSLPLDEWIAAHPVEILGEEVARRFGPRLPFLLKVLSAGEPLSIQAHPNKAQAEQLHARDPEHYPDDNHKPEIAVALDSLQALVGVRPLPELEAVVQQTPELQEFLGAEACRSFLGEGGSASQNEQERVRALFSALLRRSATHGAELQEATDRLARRLRGASRPLSEAEAWFLRLHEQYPGPDVGLFALLLLNLVHLRAGQAIYTRAGVPHAYLKGNIVECMANSDNVVRVGLTPKFKDTHALLEILDVEARPAQVLSADAGQERVRYPVLSAEFQLTRWQLAAGKAIRLEAGGRLSFLLVTRGRVMLAWDSGSMPGQEVLRPGESVLLPAVLTRSSLSAVEEAEVFQVEVPADR